MSLIKTSVIEYFYAISMMQKKTDRLWILLEVLCIAIGYILMCLPKKRKGKLD